ncbi:hypothetical protein [Austwickia chelonae]|uniref:Uncharacterized protein n=1 Tax=Austwickia chelonae NBRC 105200 TaxID=1184607 RepID=K6VNA5_9MICO|nr:hypothetical protein [Austwickia chelonae]GAB78204.1 hypothetical protein AUCHE_08_04490 [Austwickia chelonae NBRC 105200]
MEDSIQPPCELSRDRLRLTGCLTEESWLAGYSIIEDTPCPVVLPSRRQWTLDRVVMEDPLFSSERRGFHLQVKHIE